MSILNTIIAQYRTGGQNLFHWLGQSLKQEYTIVHEPFNREYNSHTNDTTHQDLSWVHKDKKYFMKDLWYPDVNYDKILEKSNVVVCLYRENLHEQVISQMYSKKTKKFHHGYTQKDVDMIFSQDDYDRTKLELEYNKKSIINFADYHKLPTVSYENLYYRDGINLIKEVFNIESNVPFPYGSKYFNKEVKFI